MIKLVLGVPGSGKSLYVLWLIAMYLRAGRQVWTNLHLTPACPFYNWVIRLEDPAQRIEMPGVAERYWPFKYPVMTEPAEVPTLDGKETRKIEFRAFWHFVPSNAVIIIDEIDNYFASDDWDSLGVKKENRLYWKQHRKAGHDVIGTLQHFENLYNKIRRQTQSVVVCVATHRASRFIRKLPQFMWGFVRGEFSSTTKMDQKTCMGNGRFSYAEGAKMFSWYRTDQILGDFICAGAKRG